MLQTHRYIPIREVSERLGYSPATVRRMVRENRLSAIRPNGPRSHIRIPESEILKLEDRCAAEAKEAALRHILRRRAQESDLITGERRSTGSLFGDLLRAHR